MRNRRHIAYPLPADPDALTDADYCPRHQLVKGRNLPCERCEAESLAAEIAYERAERERERAEERELYG